MFEIKLDPGKKGSNLWERHHSSKGGALELRKQTRPWPTWCTAPLEQLIFVTSTQKMLHGQLLICDLPPFWLNIGFSCCVLSFSGQMDPLLYSSRLRMDPPPAWPVSCERKATRTLYNSKQTKPKKEKSSCGKVFCREKTANFHSAGLCRERMA